jgi:CHASE2 domain-containing sensor protein
VSEVQQQAPPAGEELHLPGPSLIPLFSAIGIMLIVIGTTVFPPIPAVVGAIIFIVTTVRWIRDTRRDVAALPEEH